ncbi:hypothetical protein ACOTVT_03535 [Aliarcobacter butzleri]
MLKALEVLRRELQNNYEKRPFVIKTELYHKERIEDFHEAITELEALQNRSCDNCRHYKQSSTQIYKTCYANKVNGFNLESDIDFCCNKWEVKK